MQWFSQTKLIKVSLNQSLSQKCAVHVPTNLAKNQTEKSKITDVGKQNTY